METLYLLVACVIAASLYFEFTNGWNDSANAIATVVATRVLRPWQAILVAATLNFLGALGGQAVAKTIAHSIIKPEVYSVVPIFEAQIFVLAAVLAAAAWITVATRMGVPVSGSHSLLGGMLGAGVAMAGVHAVKGAGVVKVVLALLLSPLFGLIIGFLMMASIMWLFSKVSAQMVNRWFGKLQVLSVSWMAFEHGRNDAQKTMGVITLALLAGAFLLPDDQVWTWNGQQWQRAATHEGMSLSSDYSMACDSEDGIILTIAAARGHMDTIELRGGIWTRIESSPPSVFVSTPNIAHDDAHGHFVLFGVTETGAETWTYSDTAWQPIASGDAPGPRTGSAMVYDPGRAVVVLYGGETATGELLDDTWEWNGEHWSEVTTSLSPPARSRHSMCLDAAGDRVMLYGGRLADGTLDSGTWTWDGKDWRLLEPNRSPPALVGAAMTAFQGGSRIVLFGGENADREPSQETWHWEDATWSKVEVESAPALRLGAAMACDPISKLPILYGAESEKPGIPLWVIVICAVTMAVGTAAGGAKVMATVGQHLTKLRPVQGFAAETAASIVLMFAASLGLPVSTTHTITASIMGVGSTQRISAVRWGVGRKLVYAWIYTFPATMLVGALVFLIGRALFL